MIQLLTRFLARDETTTTKVTDLLSRLQASVPSEPGNISYEIFASAEDPRVLFCLESWESQEAANDHIRRNEEAGVNAEAADPLVGSPDTKTLHALK
jgi:quinol monooxygenase YgiN